MVFVDVPLRNCLHASGVWIISDLKAERYLDAFKRERLQSGLALLGIMGTFFDAIGDDYFLKNSQRNLGILGTLWYVRFDIFRYIFVISVQCGIFRYTLVFYINFGIDTLCYFKAHFGILGTLLHFRETGILGRIWNC